MSDVVNLAGEICIFCLFHRSRNNVCTYHFQHEYPNDVLKTNPPPVQVKKRSNKLCVKCGLHPNNPVSAANECEHEYPI